MVKKINKIITTSIVFLILICGCSAQMNSEIDAKDNVSEAVLNQIVMNLGEAIKIAQIEAKLEGNESKSNLSKTLMLMEDQS